MYGNVHVVPAMCDRSRQLAGSLNAARRSLPPEHGADVGRFSRRPVSRLSPSPPGSNKAGPGRLERASRLRPVPENEPSPGERPQSTYPQPREHRAGRAQGERWESNGARDGKLIEFNRRRYWAAKFRCGSPRNTVRAALCQCRMQFRSGLLAVDYYAKPAFNI